MEKIEKGEVDFKTENVEFIATDLEGCTRKGLNVKIY